MQTGYEEFKNKARHDRKGHLQRRLRTKKHASRVGSVPFSLRHNTKLNWCTNMGVWGQWQHHTRMSQFWSTSYDKNISIEHLLELLKRVIHYSHIHRISSHQSQALRVRTDRHGWDAPKNNVARGACRAPLKVEYTASRPVVAWVRRAE